MDEQVLRIVWLIAGLNALTFLVFLTDKLIARGKGRRVPEAVLLFLCLAGGSLGGLLGMTLFRHKTNAAKHPAFVYGVPTLFWIQLAAAMYFVIRGV